jgi:hypothetical protein
MDGVDTLPQIPAVVIARNSNIDRMHQTGASLGGYVLVFHQEQDSSVSRNI